MKLWIGSRKTEGQLVQLAFSRIVAGFMAWQVGNNLPQLVMKITYSLGGFLLLPITNTDTRPTTPAVPMNPPGIGAPFRAVYPPVTMAKIPIKKPHI